MYYRMCSKIGSYSAVSKDVELIGEVAKEVAKLNKSFTMFPVDRTDEEHEKIAEERGEIKDPPIIALWITL